MSRLERRNPLHSPKPPLEVVEVSSDDENTAGLGNSGVRRQSAIEVVSDFSDEEVLSDNEIQIVSETFNESHEPAPVPVGDTSVGYDDEVEITGHNQILLPDLEAMIRDAFELPVQPDLARPRVRHTTTPVLTETQGSRRRPAPGVSFLRRLRQRTSPYVHNLPHQGGLWLGAGFEFTESPNSNHVPGHVLEAIRRAEDRDMDKKLQKENKGHEKILQEKQKIAETSAEGYSSTISADDNYVCELCAVVLGEGIPDDFKPDPSLDDDLPEHAAKLRTNAPWFCVRQCFDADIELLKRVFAAKCGHVFCGRCIKNIGSRPPVKGRKKTKSTIVDPRISAPKKCPAENCGVTFRGKKPFEELYL